MRVRVHVGLVLAFPWRETGEILFNENREFLAVIEALFTLDGDLFRRRPGEHDRLGQADREHVVRKKRRRIDAGRAAFDDIAEASRAGKARASGYQPLLLQSFDFTSHQSQAHGIVTNPEFHYCCSVPTGLD